MTRRTDRNHARIHPWPDKLMIMKNSRLLTMLSIRDHEIYLRIKPDD
jgi:hypothetical protein